MSDQEPKKLERDLQKTRKDLEDLQQYINDLTTFLPLPFCTVNPLNLVLGVNQAFQDLTRYNEMEIIGNEIEFLFSEKAKLKEFREKVLSEKSEIKEEVTLIRKDEISVPVNISALARTDKEGNFLGYFLTISDISESKDFQEKLTQKVQEKTGELEKKTKELISSQEAILNILEDTDEARKKAEEEGNKTMAIVTNFTDGLIVFGKNNVIDLINPKMEKLFDISREEIVGKKLSALKNNKKTEALAEVLAKSSDLSGGSENKGQMIFREEIGTDKGGMIEVTTVPIIREKEKVGTLAVLHDISREKMVERMKSEFVTIAAHQLRTPLSAMKWTMTVLLEGDFGDLNKDQKSLVEKTYISNERTIEIINNLLDVSRIEEGKYLHRLSHVSFSEIVDSMVDVYKSEFKRRGIHLQTKIQPGKLPKVAVDIEKVNLVIQNLLDNAMKYSRNGGEATFSVVSKEKEIEVAVKDSGVGIPQDQHKRIFTKFFRAANVMRMETEGSGLGLFISKNIIESHGGKIWFESEQEKGSTFYFTLPIVESEREFEEFLKKM